MGAILHSPYGQTILGIAPVSIGKALSNQLVLNDVSAEAHHAEIRPSGHDYSIVDLGSSSGTFVNKQRLYTNIPQALQNGDTIRIGNTQFTYEVTNRAPIAPTMYASPNSPADANYPATILAPGGSTRPPSAYAPPPPSASDPYASSPSTPLAAPPPPFATGGGISSTPGFDPYASPPQKRGAKERPVWVSIIAIWAWISAAATIFLVFHQARNISGISRAFDLIIGIAAGFVGAGLWSLKPWAYRVAIVFYIISILFSIYRIGTGDPQMGARIVNLAMNSLILIYFLTNSQVRKAFRPIP